MTDRQHGVEHRVHGGQPARLVQEQRPDHRAESDAEIAGGVTRGHQSRPLLRGRGMHQVTTVRGRVERARATAEEQGEHRQRPPARPGQIRHRTEEVQEQPLTQQDGQIRMDREGSDIDEEPAHGQGESRAIEGVPHPGARRLGTSAVDDDRAAINPRIQTRRPTPGRIVCGTL
ncbi:hypothetical protein [Streptomyces litchfieldiae]|uniref:Uncharacterized protein n=1 Tax=Streptomyces litchfieldiae TaxID=3075543 RepID=A0ABU2N101_9ACTN|nr:hypothetical protein [Streptomyces sp. DSM 44938]MDT0346434.1 hypothetical protein [Streptomyces sp. DSM 44938]